MLSLSFVCGAYTPRGVFRAIYALLVDVIEGGGWIESPRRSSLRLALSQRQVLTLSHWVVLSASHLDRPVNPSCITSEQHAYVECGEISSRTGTSVNVGRRSSSIPLLAVPRASGSGLLGLRARRCGQKNTRRSWPQAASLCEVKRSGAKDGHCP